MDRAKIWLATAALAIAAPVAAQADVEEGKELFESKCSV